MCMTPFNKLCPRQIIKCSVYLANCPQCGAKLYHYDSTTKGKGKTFIFTSLPLRKMRPSIIYKSAVIPWLSSSFTRFVPFIPHFTFLHLTRYTTITRRNVQRRILQEKVPRSQEQCHGLGRHDGEIFGCGEMGQAKSMPEHDVRVGNVFVGIGGDPFRKAARGLAGCLWHVPAGRVELVVLVLCTKYMSAH